MSPYPFTHLYVVSISSWTSKSDSMNIVIGIFNSERLAENAIRTLPIQLIQHVDGVNVAIHEIPCDTTISMDTDARCVRMCRINELWSKSSALPDDVSYQKPGPGCPVYYVYETTSIGGLDWSENIVYISDTAVQNSGTCYKVVINSLIFDGIVNSNLNRNYGSDFNGDELPQQFE